MSIKRNNFTTYVKDNLISQVLKSKQSLYNKPCIIILSDILLIFCILFLEKKACKNIVG